MLPLSAADIKAGCYDDRNLTGAGAMLVEKVADKEVTTADQ
jgi:hypothetical protein